MDALPWVLGATFLGAIGAWVWVSRTGKDAPTHPSPPVSAPPVSQKLLQTPAPIPPRAEFSLRTEPPARATDAFPPSEEDFDLPTEVMSPDKVKALLHRKDP